MLKKHKKLKNKLREQEKKLEKADLIAYENNKKFGNTCLWFLLYPLTLLPLILFLILDLFFHQSVFSILSLHEIETFNSYVLNSEIIRGLINDPKLQWLATTINSTFISFYSLGVMVLFRFKIKAVLISFSILLVSIFFPLYILKISLFCMGVGFLILSMAGSILFLWFLGWSMISYVDEKNFGSIFYLFKSTKNIKKEISKTYDIKRKFVKKVTKLNIKINKLENEIIENENEMRVVLENKENKDYENILLKFEDSFKNREKEDIHELYFNQRFNNIEINNT